MACTGRVDMGGRIATLQVTFPPNPFNRAYNNSGWSRPIERG